MDINNDLQQINTFVKGMNTDVSDALMDSSQYRYAENVRLTTDTEENTGELRLVEGTAQYAYVQQYGTIKAMTSIRNLLIVITEDGGKGYILVNDTDNPSHWWITYESEDGDSWGTYLSLVTRWESDNNVKLYIADAKHPLMYVNITEKNDNGDYVTHIGNKSIQGIINTFLEQPTLTIQQGGGNLNAPKIQYAYRLYKLGGSTTTLSPLSKVLTLYSEYNKGYEASADLVYNINQSVVINIPTNSYESDHLQIFRISYISQDSNPHVSLIYDDVYINSFTDTGQNDVDDNVSYSTFLSYIDFNTVPRVIESKNDYLFQANINDVQSKIDSKYDKIDVAQYISWQITNKPVYVSNRNEKRYSMTSGNVKDQFKSLRLGEVYRYGVVLYDSDGNHTSVKHIADIDLQNEISDNSVYSIHYYNDDPSSNFYQFKLIGIKFEVNWDGILQECPDCKAIEIVRCKRTISDRRTITQGIGGYPLRIWDKDEFDEYVQDKGVVCSPGLISTNRFAVTGNIREEPAQSSKFIRIQSKIAVSDNNKLIFTSPEYVYQKDDIKDILSSGNFYLTLDGVADTATYQYQQYGNYEPYQINARRIYSKRAQYDYGVPYCVYKTPNDINELYTWLYARYNGEGNTQPPYEDWDNGTVTYIHTSWIATYFARLAYDSIDQDYYHIYINKREIEQGQNYNPKVYMSSSEFVTTFNVESTINNIDVNKTTYAIVPKAGDLFDSTMNPPTFNGSESFSEKGSFDYLNWIIPIAYEVDSNDATELKQDRIRAKVDDSKPDWEQHDSGAITNTLMFQSRNGSFTYPVGSTGECIIFEKTSRGNFYENAATNIGLDIVSIKKDVLNPYGGQSTIKSSKYISHGNVISVDTGTKDYDIYDGDCFPGVFIYNASHAWCEGGLGNAVAQANIQSVPLYSDIDLSGTFGYLIPNLESNIVEPYWFQDQADKIEEYTQTTAAYRYNTSYNSDPTAVPYVSIEYTKIDTDTFDCRVKHSDPKTNNEHIDSWLKFDDDNYIDVDSRFGQITNMRLFKDKLLFWQEHATGILSVNERTVLNDIENNDIVVGTGGTLQRYDYISTVYGMKPNQYDAEIQSNSTQYWWDGYNKEILAYGGGMELVPLTKIKGVTNYINQREESERPILAYDTKYDEILAQVVSDETLVYNEQIQAFSSIYTFMPQYRASIGNDLYLAKENLIYRQNQQDEDGYTYLFDKPAFPKVRIVVNKNNIYTKTFDNLTFGGRMYKGSLQTIANWQMERVPGEYVKDEHLNSPMHHLTFTFETPLKQKSAIRGDKSTSVDEYDYRLAIPRNGSQDSNIEYGNRMRGKTMQCEMASDYNSTDFSLQYITTKFRMSWS